MRKEKANGLHVRNHNAITRARAKVILTHISGVFTRKEKGLFARNRNAITSARSNVV